MNASDLANRSVRLLALFATSDVDDSSGKPATDVVAASSDDKRTVECLRAAVRADRLKPNQKAIRVFLECGQQRAGYPNRLNAARFGSNAA